VILLRVHEAAALAIVEQADYYRQAADDSLAARWESSIDQTVHSLLQMPERGTPCRFKPPELSDLRWIPVRGFPKHMIFYRFDADEQALLIVNVVHGARDLAVALATDDSPKET
jgi:plasmid stabilization system protein ParE